MPELAQASRALAPIKARICNGFLDSSAHREISIYSNLPPDLFHRMRAALFASLKVKDPYGDIGTDHLKTVRIMRASGIEESEIRQAVTDILEEFLSKGRRAGLNDGVPGLQEPLRPLVSGQEVSAESKQRTEKSFVEKYDLRRFDEIRKRITTVTFQGDFYNDGLPHAFKLALEIGDLDRALEALLHLLRLKNLGQVSNLIEALSKPGHESALINVVLFGLSELLLNDWQNTNYIGSSFYALSRVQGPMRKKAEQLMVDFAREILGNPNHFTPSSQNYALSATLHGIVSLGEVAESRPVYLGTQNRYRTVQPVHDVLIRDIVDRLAAENEISAWVEEIFPAVVSLEDPVYSREIIALLRTKESPAARSVAKKLNDYLANPEVFWSDFAEPDDYSREVRNPILEMKLSKEIETLVEDEARARWSVFEDPRNRSLNESERRKLIREAREHLNQGHAHEAEWRYMQLISRSGMIAVGDLYLKMGAGQRAREAYLHAAVMPDDGGILPGVALR